jgi:signal transduction histidine kinase/DNA-binding beta-propeller fold protein YncE
MKSIGARLAFWYALAATATFASLTVAGYFMLEHYLVHGLDLLNAAEFQQIRAHLVSDGRPLSAPVIDERIRETTEYASVLFYIDVHGKNSGPVFRSSNLHGQTIPDVPHQRIFNASLPDTGPMRVGEFILPPHDVMVATPLHPVYTVMDAYAEVSAALVALMLAVSAAIGFGLSHVVLRPLRLIQATANRIRSDNLSERIEVAPVQDEISNLARLLNQMFDRLESSFNQIRRFTADASHELKTPLSLMRLHAENLLLEGDLTFAQEEALHIQLEEMDRLTKIIEDLLFLSRAEAQAIPLDLQTQPPADFLTAFSPDARALAEHAGVHCSIRIEGSGTVTFDPKWIRQVLLNLVKNSIAASSKGTAILITSALGPSIWRVTVEDEGQGVPPEQRERIFERFFRLGLPTGQDDKGTGLGLAICRSIIELHGGRIFAAQGAHGRGLRIVFEIPVVKHDGADEQGRRFDRSGTGIEGNRTPTPVSAAGSVIATLVLVLLSAVHPAHGQNAPGAHLYSVTKTIPLGQPDRWDYLTYDAASHRIYAAHGTSIDVLDAHSGALLGQAPVPGANGVAVVAPLGKGYAGSRANKSVRVFDLKTFKILKDIPVGEDTDAVVYDPASKRVFVMEGDPHKAVAIDTATDTVAGEVALSGDPEFAAADGTGRLFVNIADQRAIQRIDTRTLKVDATWPVPECESPHGLSFDPGSQRLFSTCINLKLIVLDVGNGAILKSFPIGQGSDASAFDPGRRRVFSSNGSGSLTVIRVDGPDKFELLAEIPTQPLARTMTVDPESGRVYLLSAERVEVDPTATTPRKRYGVAPGTARLLFLDPAN